MSSKFFFVVIVTALCGCSQPLRVARYENQQYRFTPEQNVTIDSAVYSQIKPYQDSLAVLMTNVLGRSAAPLVKTALANFMADACYQQLKKMNVAPFDFIVFNRGGLRRTLPAGNITEGDIFELMPFENSLVLAQLDGTTTMELCQFIGKRGSDPVAGITMSYSDDVLQNILINGTPIDTTRTYWVVTNSYMVNGGDDFVSFTKRQGFYDTKFKVRDAIINYLVEKESHGEVIQPDHVQRLRK